MRPTTLNPPFALHRRHLLGAAVAAGTVALFPWSLATSEETGSKPVFFALSTWLVGREQLDPALGERLLKALQDNNPQFDPQAAALLAWIKSNQVDVRQLSSALQATHPELAALPPQIMTAWYMGIVGSGAQAKVLAYEKALNAVAVSDKLVPPTYAFGAPGGWTHNPNV